MIVQKDMEVGNMENELLEYGVSCWSTHSPDGTVVLQRISHVNMQWKS